MSNRCAIDEQSQSLRVHNHCAFTVQSLRNQFAIVELCFAIDEQSQSLRITVQSLRNR
jgi:hypothetical protein